MSIMYIILVFKPDEHLLKKNLGLLGDRQVVIVNNNPDLLLKDILTVIVNTGKNFGYAGGMNVGMTYAWKNNADWVVLLNDDVELTTQGIEEVEKKLKTLVPGVYGPETGSLDKKRYTTILHDETIEYVSGSVMCIHRDVDTVVKGFYEPYFMYYEDVDYCLRSKKAGYPIQKLNIDFIHKQSQSIGNGSNLHHYYLARNHLLFVFRQAPMAIKLYEFMRLPKTMWEYVFARQK